MQNTPKSLRLQIAVLGRVNSGKSSFINLLTGQQTSIIAPLAGTTTDVVEKAMELPPLGPVLLMDTAGFGDETELKTERMKKAIEALHKADIVLLICEGETLSNIEYEIIRKAEGNKTPLIKIYNKADKFPVAKNDGLTLNSLDLSQRDAVLSKLTELLIKKCPADFLSEQPLLGDLTPKNSTIIMIIPLDYEAPRGRLILPQVQAIRDCLDHNQNIIVCKENNYKQTLENLKTPPALVVCDSQIVDLMVQETPPEMETTSEGNHNIEQDLITVWLFSHRKTDRYSHPMFFAIQRRIPPKACQRRAIPPASPVEEAVLRIEAQLCPQKRTPGADHAGPVQRLSQIGPAALPNSKPESDGKYPEKWLVHPLKWSRTPVPAPWQDR